ncbi:DNA protecting protein DprA [Gammaproteobacteria bacterium 45_16_T64]|nr:DNA protecting protein DprA [Gammaproteobacteria bacterium 45_16_T64]
MQTRDTNTPYWLAMWRLPRVGPVTFTKVLAHADNDLEYLFSQSVVDLKRCGFNDTQVELISGFYRDRQLSLGKQVDQDLQWLDASSQHHVVLNQDATYPPLLKEVIGAPPLLFVKGDLDTLAFPQIAIVGSRNPTRMGQDTAYKFAQHFAKQGFITTSGLARGIDGAAHQGALVAQGYTVAVLAHGLDQIYPKANQGLADQIAENGAMVSEYPIGVGPRAEYFPRRNRIVSGMSLGVLVVEAAKKSGSLITAREAAEQGREVFAIPGSIHNPLAKGCHEIIRQGAKLVEEGAHVIEELLPLLTVHNINKANAVAKATPEGHSPVQKSCIKVHQYADKSTEIQVLKVIEHDACSVDFVVSETGLSVAEVNSTLILLELDGAIVSENGWYLLA